LFKINELDVFYRLKNYQDNIQSVNLTLSLPDTIKIEVGSYKEVFNVVVNEKNYILLEN
jgi:cell division septal protein FtsQ